MSWFSELTSKAESLLVKLDQNAADALQNPDGILKGTKILDQAINTITTKRADDVEPLIQRTNESSDDSKPQQKQTTEFRDNVVEEDNLAILETSTSSAQEFSKEAELSNIPQSINGQNNQIQNDNLIINTDENPQQAYELTPATEPPSAGSKSTYSRKFTIQTSKSGSKSFQSSRHKNTKKSGNLTLTNKEKIIGPESRSQVDSLGADDIRASINRSLQEYTNLSSSPSRTGQEHSNETAYSSYYDSRPNVVHQKPLMEPENRFNSSSLLNAPSSFSIELPDERPETGTGSVAMEFLKNNVMKKKSTSYLHNVINRLASASVQNNGILNDKTKIRMRRVQLRVGSYARRLNHYYRTNPSLKYWMIGYLILMQILVVYVLFFYQSSSSSSDLSTQIKQQQLELKE